jgi:hypothetical protein
VTALGLTVPGGSLAGVTIGAITCHPAGRAVPGGRAAAGGNFSILRFPDPDLSEIYTEQLNSALYLDRPGHADDYAVAMERLCNEAEPPERTADILTGIIKDLSIDHG